MVMLTFGTTSAVRVERTALREGVMLATMEVGRGLLFPPLLLLPLLSPLLPWSEPSLLSEVESESEPLSAPLSELPELLELLELPLPLPLPLPESPPVTGTEPVTPPEALAEAEALACATSETEADADVATEALTEMVPDVETMLPLADGVEVAEPLLEMVTVPLLETDTVPTLTWAEAATVMLLRTVTEALFWRVEAPETVAEFGFLVCFAPFAAFFVVFLAPAFLVVFLPFLPAFLPVFLPFLPAFLPFFAAAFLVARTWASSGRRCS